MPGPVILRRPPPAPDVPYPKQDEPTWFDKALATIQGVTGLPLTSPENYQSGGDMLDRWSAGGEMAAMLMGPLAAMGVLAKAGKGAALAGESAQALQPASNLGKRIPNPIKAYHGSPHDFDQFSLSKIGTGEGAQAYGHGLYFAEAEGVAQDYRKRLSGQGGIIPGATQGRGRLMVGGVAPPEGIAGHKALDTAQDIQGLLYYKKAGYADMADVVSQQIERRIANWKATNPQTGIADSDMRDLVNYYEQHVKSATPDLINERPPGRMYEVNIHATPDELLDWDKPLSQQSEKVKGSLESLGIRTTEGGLSANQMHARAKRYFEGNRAQIDAAEDIGMRERVREAYREYQKGPEAFSEWARRQSPDSWVMSRMIGPKGTDSIVGTGDVAYSRVVRQHEGASGRGDVAAKKLREAGIKGIQYLDQGSRGKADQYEATKRLVEKMKAGGHMERAAEYQAKLDQMQAPSRNFVIFDDELIEIAKKYGIPLAMATELVRRQGGTVQSRPEDTPRARRNMGTLGVLNP